MFDTEELTVDDIALKCVTLSGRNEEDIIADYERRCKRHRVVPLYGQLKNGLRRLFKAGKVFFKTRDGHKLLCKKGGA